MKVTTIETCKHVPHVVTKDMGSQAAHELFVRYVLGYGAKVTKVSPTRVEADHLVLGVHSTFKFEGDAQDMKRIVNVARRQSAPPHRNLFEKFVLFFR